MYQLAWLPLQKLLTSAELEQLFWLDLVQRDDTVTQSDTYARQQARMDLIPDEDGIVAELQRIARLGRLLHVVLNPEQEPDAAVRARLQRLRDWDTTTVVPLLVHLLDRRDRGEATSAELASAMLSVESYIVRRVLSYKATAGLNRVLLRAVIDMQGKPRSMRRCAPTCPRAEGTGPRTSRSGTRRTPFPSTTRAARSSRSSSCCGSRSRSGARSRSTRRP